MAAMPTLSQITSKPMHVAAMLTCVSVVHPIMCVEKHTLVLLGLTVWWHKEVGSAAGTGLPGGVSCHVSWSLVIYYKGSQSKNDKPLLNTSATSHGAPLQKLLGLHLALEGPKGKALAVLVTCGMFRKERP